MCIERRNFLRRARAYLSWSARSLRDCLLQLYLDWSSVAREMSPRVVLRSWAELGRRPVYCLCDVRYSHLLPWPRIYTEEVGALLASALCGAEARAAHGLLQNGPARQRFFLLFFFLNLNNFFSKSEQKIQNSNKFEIRIKFPNMNKLEF
jgi:hypothetical protein